MYFAPRAATIRATERTAACRDANSGGGGGQGERPAPLASRLHRIRTHFSLHLHGT
jgi:hypothetical protein